ncbi:cytochrome b/b6 domain-containing protein [Microbacterium sp. bgisy189]|uniref:cytochrome b/b6 domain-containing protein n=1 Tax=Microbacterium sp. bgisy189 TaxID=3413798 RepID=UPI003EB885A7
MATLRRGLPRTPGGDAWPAAGEVAAPDGAADVVDSRPTADPPAPDAQLGANESAAPAAPPAALDTGEVVEPAAAAASASPAGVALRRGLPRARGGEPWPPATASGTPAVRSRETAVSEAPREPFGANEAPTPTVGSRRTAASEVQTEHFGANEVLASPAEGAELRRGLPRTAGGDGWPPAGTVAASAVPAAAPATRVTEPATEPAAAQVDAAPAAPAPAAAPVAAPAAEVAKVDGPRAPLTLPRTVWPGRAASVRPQQTEPQRIGPFTKLQWAGVTVVGGAVLLLLAGMAVAVVRVVLSLEFMQDFIETYPGEYHLPETAPVGIPAWLGWQHFFNVFLMVLVIKTGLTIRGEKRPTAFWAPKNNPRGKTSLTIWTHQALDILWLVNGVVFVVLLFVTGHWMRIVPTSWEVFPNALSAALQYVSLDWPTENGWVNYNSLQQLAYFTTVFIAAPLAAITGYRMSGFWPKNNKQLSKAYPIEWARKVHFPVMLYFVAFIIVHVALVFATGALRNLNHMYASLGSEGGIQYAENWTGFWIFFASLVVIAGGVAVVRPMLVAPVARLFGTVSGR